MMTYSNELPDLSTSAALQADADLYSPHTVTLSVDTMRHAQVLCQAIRPAEKGQAYHNAIALLGFQQWLTEQGIDITSSLESCSVYGETIAGLLPGVCGLQVGGFHVCLLPISSLAVDWIAVPRAAIELEHYMAQMLIGIEVRDEPLQVTIWGSLRWDTLQTHCINNAGLVTNDDWTYRIPRRWFTPHDDRSLLLYLRCLEPDAIPLTPVLPDLFQQASATDTLEGEIPVLRHLLESTRRPLWKLLSWNKAIELFKDPSLAESLLLSSHSSSRPSFSVVSTQVASSQELPQGVSPLSTEAVINTAQWLQGELDEIAQSLQWYLLPALEPGLRQRSATETDPNKQLLIEHFEDVRHELKNRNLDLPANTRGVVRDFEFGGYCVRVYVMMWQNSNVDDAPQEWSLAALWGPAPDVLLPLPEFIHLQIRDQNQVLYNQTISESTPERYRFAQVIGEWQECFWMSIEVANYEPRTLVFTFDPTNHGMRPD